MITTKIIILVIGIIVIVAVASASIIIPQLMIKSVSKRVSQYKVKEGTPVEEYEVEVLSKRCKSYEEGRCRTIRQADDCEIEFRFLRDETSQFIMVPYGIYMAVKEWDRGMLFLQDGEYRNFKEEQYR